MGIPAAAIRKMVEMGLMASDIADLCELLDQKNQATNAAATGKSKAAERMARYRDHRRANGLTASFDGKAYFPALNSRDGALCVYCVGVPGTVVDHMVPISQGGTDDLDNLALACTACNCGKAGRLPGEGGYILRVETAAAAHVRYTREQNREHVREHTGEQVREHGERSHGRVRDITPNSEISGLAVVVEVSASDCATNDWPKGDVAQALIETIASPRLDPSKSQGLVTTAGRLAAWRRDGASWQFDVLPVIQAAVRKTGPPIGTWKYFDAAIAQSIADNRQALTIPKARNHGSPQPPGQQSKQADNLARALAGADLASQFLAQRR